ncbi:MAG: 4Fe-4S dicluster domain-containing protein [Clostridiales Family XIII bacterium]|nr:4Fe-4S dicluster domain-containing protein [Clostridiales Family XIII bacterium]
MTANQQEKSPESWYEAYEVPEAARGVMDLLLSSEEQRLIAAFIGASFSAADVREEFGLGSEAEASKLLRSAYRRGVVSAEDADAGSPRYHIGSFFPRLTVYAVTEQDSYQAIPEATRAALEALYFDRYYDALDWDEDGGRPTKDAVLTLGETLGLLEAKKAAGKNIYRVNCDCRSLKNGCDHVRDVCITFEDGTNTWPDRGIAESISLDEAKDVIRKADKDGLIHTSSPHGICNCCTDCCYLFRSRARRGSGRTWPASSRIIDIAAEACVGCGLCVKRCPLGALSLKSGASPAPDKKAVRDDKACIGCGLCISSCNFGALSLRADTVA